MNLYREFIFLSCGDRILCKVESLIMILFSASLSYLVPPSSGWLSILLWSSQADTCIKNLVLVVSSSYHQWRWKDNHFLLEIAQPKDVVESNLRGIFTWLFISCITTAIWSDWPQLIACYNCLSAWFGSTKPVKLSFLFDIKNIRKLYEWFSCTCIFSIFILI